MPVTSSVFISVFPGHGSLMGLVRGIFGIWVIGDSPTGEPGIAGTGDSFPGLWGESGSSSVGDSPLVCRGSPASWLLAGDNSSGLGGELASVSAVDDSCSLEFELDVDSLSLRGRGMDMLWSVLTWGLLLS